MKAARKEYRTAFIVPKNVEGADGQFHDELAEADRRHLHQPVEVPDRSGFLASIGTADVSGAGPIMLAMVLAQIGVPVEGIALVIGVDKIFDMGRTTLNITGDATCAIWVSRLEQRKAARKAATQA
ncbi:MAG: cation:dicarboxylase symporter family transporter [Clostridia bacterium]|nr:cation:dicarboxylase symporter family transporter [Clostridia bacterium]